MRTPTVLQREREHHRRCFLCYPTKEHDVPDLCFVHYWLLQWRLWRFLLRTNQYGKGRWKP
ncbi:MAG TPA: hypothetical protein VKV40_08075 [Ktedonobacteraceae bacterium]|nr:hypothetical protein [Ktedonobacteraceae bacterium]